MLVGAVVCYGYLRAVGLVGKDGRGFIAALRHPDRTRRRAAFVTIVGLSAACALMVAVEQARAVHEWVTGQLGCTAVPGMWTPSVVFTALLIGLCATRLVSPVAKFAEVAMALLALTVGFWLATWDAPLVPVVWVPVLLAFMPILVGGSGRPAGGDSDVDATSA